MVRKHADLIRRTREYVNKNETAELIESELSYSPDICLEDSHLKERDFDQVWFEAEYSSTRKPSDIVNKIVRACESNSKIVFVVPASSDDKIDYYATRIDNVIGSPSLRCGRLNKNQYTLYKSNEYLRTDNDKIALCETKGDWIYDDLKDEIWYRKPGKLRISEPEPVVSVSEYQVEATGILTDTGIKVRSEDNNTDRLSNTRYEAIKKPVYPFHIPRSRREKVIKSVEYLIFGENVIYHRKHPHVETHITGF